MEQCSKAFVAIVAGHIFVSTMPQMVGLGKIFLFIYVGAFIALGNAWSRRIFGKRTTSKHLKI